MGRLIPTTDPNYDNGLDLDMVVAASRAEIAGTTTAGLHENIQVEEHTADRIVLSGKSMVGAKNIWMAVSFADQSGGTRVTSKVIKAHTAAPFYLFGIGIGTRTVRGLGTYVTLTDIWRANFAALHTKAGGA